MKLVTFRNFFMVGGLALVLMSASYEAQAQGRGQGESNRDKKCSKFVNCHDASEGRWDGRGPRRTDSDNWNSRRFRHGGDFDNFSDQQRQRRHHHDREFNRNDYWRNRDRSRNRTWSHRGR